MSAVKQQSNSGGGAVKRTSVTLKPGDAGIRQTIAAMRKLALADAKNAAVKQQSNKLTAGKSSDVERIKAIYTYVWTKHPYKSDPEDEELIIAPRHMLTKPALRSGDCDDLSTLLASLLIAAGFKAAFKTIAWRRQEYTHVYCMVYVPSIKGWIPLDPVKKKDGFGGEKAPIIRSRTWGINK